MVYTVAGAALYTSTRILDAEARLLTAAGRRGGASVDQTAVDLALLEMAAKGPQSMLGKRHWSARCAPPGHVCSWRSPPPALGRRPPCAPSPWPGPKKAVRCSAWPCRLPRPPFLPSKPGIHTDTLAKLTWSLRHGELPDWATAADPSTLVIIDEAGMADTLSLDTAVQFAINRGASVRLIGDDQQLAAIGAGGVLRDIQQSHGALRLTVLHRFTDPAEASAHRWPSATATLRGLSSILITAGSMSATSPPRLRMRSTLGFPTCRRTRRDHARAHSKACRRTQPTSP